MPEPFKNFFNPQLILAMAGHFQNQWPAFDSNGFSDAASKNLDALELKARSNQIVNAMIMYLPGDFSQAGKIMLASLSPALEGDLFGVTVDNDGIAGWAVMPMTHYVGLRGHGHFDLSMTLFKELTKRFTSEFGIRFFLLESPDKTLSVLRQWTTDKDRHVRRLVSEGTRPRLPWAMCLPRFIKDPSPVIELLEALKDDDEEYVRRSVANNLNDIARDHPDVVADIAEQWLKDASDERQKLVRHACRTLIKSGHKKVMRVFGYAPPKIRNTVLDVNTPELEFGGALGFSLSITSASGHDQALMIDYVIHHRKANGKTSPKVFKWQIKTLEANKTLTVTKKHVIKKITTRVYYPGVHTVEVMVNGISVGAADFNLWMP